MKKVLSACLVALFVCQVPALAIGSKKAAYVGGTAAEFKDAKKVVEGQLVTNDETHLKFAYNNGQEFSIPYSKFIDIEYGRKSGRRVGVAVATTILLGPIGLLSLMSKKRKHYVTIGYYDEAGKEQVAVFELGKDLPRTVLPILEARSGKKVLDQDKEERKAKEEAKAKEKEEKEKN